MSAMNQAELEELGKLAGEKREAKIKDQELEVLPVYFVSLIWRDRAPFRPKVDEFVPRTLHVNLRIASQPE